MFGHCSSPILCNRGSFYYVEARWKITFPLDFPAISFANVGNGSKRSSTMWASVRRAHKHKPTKGYSYARAVTGDVSATPTTE